MSDYSRKLSRGRRIYALIVTERERALGCSSCTLSRCREGIRSCNLVRITLEKRAARKARTSLPAAASQQGQSSTGDRERQITPGVEPPRLISSYTAAGNQLSAADDLSLCFTQSDME